MQHGQRQDTTLGFYRTILEMIDMGSFSSLWFWIGLAVMWSSASRWVLGVPYDMLARARKDAESFSAQDVNTLAHISVRRLLYITRLTGLWMVALGCFVVTALAILGFAYHVEFAQAVFFLAVPMIFVGLLSISVAKQIEEKALIGPELYDRLLRLRLAIQGIGVFAIFVTSLWGMWQNLRIGAL